RGEQWREAKTVSALVLLLPPTFVPDGRRQREEISEERSQNPYLNFRKTHLRQAFFSFFFFLQTEFLEFPRQREEISEENPPEPISELPKNPSQARSDLVLHLPPTSVPDGRRQREEISEERSQNPLPSFRKTHLRSPFFSFVFFLQPSFPTVGESSLFQETFRKTHLRERRAERREVRTQLMTPSEPKISVVVFGPSSLKVS
ncbi:uncharacterized protein LOC122066447, partial [Macadamia integrifolia]|uniref:uncharacterized protein LOC122066447 n=1 Tax=Macadamia integrifolia TaxID=60698 RepID=UPI001C4E83B4